MESQEYHQDEAATHADEDITYLQEDALFAAPPTLEIVDGAEECEFIGEGDDFECKDYWCPGRCLNQPRAPFSRHHQSTTQYPRCPQP